MKRTGLILLTILSIASCSHTRDLDIPEAAQDAVGFDVYTRSSVSTKAGFTGDIDEASFKVAGFGVYAYVGTTPDFMRNQHVTYSGGSWVYSPVKYWPNQDTDKISFYAYGPHVSSAPYTTAEAAITNANNEEGILYIPGTDATGDPVIVYKTAADPSNNVDLMFGVAAEDHTSPDVTAGLPFLDMTKLMLGEKMKFNFKHALTKLVVNVDGYFDDVNSGSAGNHEVDANTRIVVESVNISTDRLATYGTLNLKNTEVNTPKWELGTTSTTLSAYPLPVASNLLYIDGNETSVVHFSQQPLGVTKTKQSLMGYGIDGTTAASLMFVPNGAGTGNLDVTIVYHVITRDARLETGYNDVTNTITKTITGLTGNVFKPGYLTTLNLHLGLASVTFDADVSDWTGGESQGADFPKNYPYNITFTSDAAIPMMMWKNGGNVDITAQVFESGIDQTDSGFTFDWQSSNTAVASVSSTTKNASISPHSVGETTITLTVEKSGISQEASFNVYVNAISGIVLTTNRGRVDIAKEANISATLTFEESIFGSLTSLPFSLLSITPGGSSYLSLSAPTLSSNVVTSTLTGVAYGGSSHTITATVPAVNTSSGEELTQTISVTCSKIYGFTVASGKTVEIARSNLKYTGNGDGTGIWALTEDPWTLVESSTIVAENYGYDSSGQGTTPISLFGWGTSGWNNGNVSYQPYNTTSNYEQYGPVGNYSLVLIDENHDYRNADWGIYNTTGGRSISRLDGSGWRTLTSAEWIYLFNTRTDHNSKYGHCRIKIGETSYIKGMLLLPDDWAAPTGFSFASGTGGYDRTTFDATASSGAANAWVDIEAAGAVFLPAAGYRPTTTVSNMNSQGYYWASTEYHSYERPSGAAKCIRFYTDSVLPDDQYVRNYGLSVRLVREID